MNRRYFFTALTGLLGLAAAPSILKESTTQLGEDLISSKGSTFVHKFRTAEAMEQMFGVHALHQIQELRTRFFENGKLVSLKQVAKKSVSSSKPEIQVILSFNSTLSKEEYLKERARIFSSGLSLSKNS